MSFNGGNMIDPRSTKAYKLEKENRELKKEIGRLNNIIKKLETDLYNMYITFGEFSEEYAEKCIKELKGSNDNGNL